MTSGSRCPVQVTQVLPGSGSREWGEGPVSGAVDPAPALNGKPLLLFYHTLRTYVIVSFKGFMCLKKKNSENHCNIYMLFPSTQKELKLGHLRQQRLRTIGRIISSFLA